MNTYLMPIKLNVILPTSSQPARIFNPRKDLGDVQYISQANFNTFGYLTSSFPRCNKRECSQTCRRNYERKFHALLRARENFSLPSFGVQLHVERVDEWLYPVMSYRDRFRYADVKLSRRNQIHRGKVGRQSAHGYETLKSIGQGGYQGSERRVRAD